jgi:hypothetical protein
MEGDGELFSVGEAQRVGIGVGIIAGNVRVTRDIPNPIKPTAIAIIRKMMIICER